MQGNRQDIQQLSPEEHARLAHAVMRRQATLSIQVAFVFITLLFGLPLFNFWFAEQANHPVFGFTATWLFLGILFFPITWLLSAYFVRRSDRIESECADWRTLLGQEAGEPLEPEGIAEVQPAFIATEEESRP